MWAPDSTHILFDSNGRLWLYDLHNGTGVEDRLLGPASGDDPKFSPDGSIHLADQDHGLAVIPLHEPGTPTIPLAPAPNPSSADGQEILNGEVDWVYEEELDVRSNYFWSPDSKKIAYLQMNETKVPQYPITDWIPNHATVDWQRYPQPGDPNPEVHLGVVPVRGGKTVWMRSRFTTATITFRALAGSTARPSGSKHSLAITSTARCFLPTPITATRGRCSRSATISSSMTITT